MSNPADMTFAREHRYSCLDCRDSGWVKIYHPEAVKAAMSDPDSAPWWKTCLVLCTCPAADQHATTYSERSNGPRRGKPVPVFGDQRWHFAVTDEQGKVKAANYNHHEWTPE